MAAFVESDVYLDFGARPHGKRMPVLWPVMVHRVMFPEPRHIQLNLLQRAVLGLVRARTVRAQDMAELTGLHLDLIKLILAQAVSNGWLVESADALTLDGARLLDDEDVDDTDMKSGYLIQDALTGNFWPRLVVQLRQIEAEDPSARFPEFSQSRTTGKKIRPFLLSVPRMVLPPLDHEALRLAYRDYRMDYQASQQLANQSELPERLTLQGVQRLDDTAQPARVLVWVTADVSEQALWSVKDPFMLRDNAWWLQDTLMNTIESDGNLRSRLTPLVNIPQLDNQSVEEWLKAIQQQTELQVLVEYPWVERQPDIKRHLVALLARQEKLQQGDNSEQELNAALLESQKLLEVLMQWMIRTFPAAVGQLPKQQKQDSGLNQQILNALQVPSFTKSVISSLSRQRIGQVVRACSRPTESLKALLFAAAMGTLNEPRHPLKTLSADQLQLDQLLELADLRNSSSHAQSSYTGREQVQLTSSMALSSIQYALRFTSYFKEWM